MELCWDEERGEELCGFEYENKKRKTRRERLLEQIRPYDPKDGKGRAPYELESMLRVHCVQLFYNLKAPRKIGKPSPWDALSP